MEIENVVVSAGSLKQGDEIPDLVFATGPAGYTYMYSQSREFFDAFVRKSWVTPKSYFAYTNTTVACTEDGVIGMEIGFSGADWYGFKKAGADIVRSLIENGQATLEQARHLGVAAYKNYFQLPYVPPDAYYILAIANKLEARGQGIGKLLLENAFLQAKESEYRTLHLDVYSDNPAVQFYEGMGMTCMAETSCPELHRDHGIPMEKRMVIRL